LPHTLTINSFYFLERTHHVGFDRVLFFASTSFWEVEVKA
jgi:hypothetical protein